MNNKILFFVYMTIFFIAGSFLTWTINSKIINNPISCKNDQEYQRGWDEAKANFQKYFNSGFNDNNEIKFLNGTITKVGSGRFDFDIIIIDPTADKNLNNRTVEISQSTLISQVVRKTDEEYGFEMEKYKLDLQNGMLNDQEQAPSMYKKVKVDFSKFSSGQKVQVFSDTDVRAAKTFVAKEIIIQLDN